jgi:hypothetical protein
MPITSNGAGPLLLVTILDLTCLCEDDVTGDTTPMHRSLVKAGVKCLLRHADHSAGRWPPHPEQKGANATSRPATMTPIPWSPSPYAIGIATYVAIAAICPARHHYRWLK